MESDQLILEGLRAATEKCYQSSFAGGWWTDLETGQPKQRNKAEMLMLLVSEVAEMLEGIRKDLQDDHLPEWKMEHMEAADIFIRLADFCGGFNIDLGAAVLAKLKYNKERADHKPEYRKTANGKKF